MTIAGFLIVHRRVSSPIRRLTEVMRRLAEHDLTTELQYIDRADEIGDMCRAVLRKLLFVLPHPMRKDYF